ncbi:MAG TPA: 2'-5' RNA ligase family protein [Nocardioidaceae bacterium]|jgi:hypothetical protein|nr:2'-5' RNA ligase family protein [Nocardioidaceae bacterium]
MAHSLLMVPVPEAEFVVRPRLARRSPQDLSPDPDEIAAHVTLLGPFAPKEAIDEGLLSELRSFFADVLPFEFRLTRVSRFPSGPTYLTPAPAAPFRQLTLELHRRFPEYPPYEGRFDEVVPHLSVPLPDGEDTDALATALASRLPITAHAREAALYWWEEGAGHTVESFPFGTTAA